MRTHIKNIIFTVLAGVLISCEKDGITVEKNNDLKWSIDKKIENEDIRTRIGYNPNKSYIVSDTKKEFFVKSLGSISLQEEELVGHAKVVLTKVLDKDIRVTLTYDESLYQELKTVYVGYQLASEQLIKAQKELVIKAGETESTFEFVLSVIPETKRLLFPYKVKVEGENSVEFIGKGSDILTVVVSSEDISAQATWMINPVNSSDKFKGIFESVLQKNKEIKKETLLPKIKFGVLGGYYRSKGLLFYSRYEHFNFDREVQYPADTNVNVENHIQIKLGNPTRTFTRYYSHLTPLIESFEQHSPYKVEKLGGGVFKFVSVEDNDFWFIFTKE
ncbi:hypothetical protein [Capnocytophaga felis]|uniref:DUF1735 domain-containing protein n=1 Tax=Capnocytophaga felis TaxID=2267611 RepID=A0A5M4B5Z9_9FLAO|nr:hypothetical protein [Capnocytophaga felis]GET44928.1 hypothetical protein RCZ01_02300 [Capnocytophaga felis]GET49380.1 hypothetical protein RCZ02_22110 [Capnocytophaga felis]